MAFLLIPLLTAIMFLVMSILSVKNKKMNNLMNKKKRLLPPGELGLPWIGETLDFYRAQKKNKILEEFIQPRIDKYGKIFKTRIMGSPTVVVNGADANRFFLSNEFKLVVSAWPSSSVQLMGKNSIMEKQGESHRFIRGIISSSLNPNGLESIVPKICKLVQSHLDKHWDGQESVRLYDMTKTLTLVIVFECLFGVDEVEPTSTLANFEKVLEGVFATPIDFPGSRFSRAKKARVEIGNAILKIVREKKEEMNSQDESSLGGEDQTLIWRLVTALRREEMSEEEVVDNMILLVYAAHDTTSFAIAMTFKMLSLHPHSYAQLLQEHNDIMRSKKDNERLLTFEDTKKLKYTWQVARESMRLFPPIFGSFRKAITDIDYQGFTIPKGWKVLWTTYGTHNNEEYFKDPQTFDPSRFDETSSPSIQPYVFIPFGGGPRLCAGYQLAKLNILVFVHYVVTRYNWSMMKPDEPIAMDPLPFPSYGMPIRISPK
ncbi:taxadiene 5-alpha hydroxylase [Impatiens glandulifera]|uniref:taxadiene 5-alpha hydroxylase n=1 Tax=Impatiens glandulifera TaxID=253017 RepID=UPI001FB11AF7|nr:taxadiene 5-alpha hydroxylase [Impatiens glandulifera]